MHGKTDHSHIKWWRTRSTSGQQPPTLSENRRKILNYHLLNHASDRHSLSPSLVHHSFEAAEDFACNLNVLMCFFRESCLSFRIFYLNHSLAILLLTCLMPQLRQTRSNRIRNITMKEITTKTRWKKNYVQTTKNCLFLFFILIMCIRYAICCVWREMTLSQFNGEHSMKRSAFSPSLSLHLCSSFSFSLEILCNEALFHCNIR